MYQVEFYVVNLIVYRLRSPAATEPDPVESPAGPEAAASAVSDPDSPVANLTGLGLIF